MLVRPAVRFASQRGSRARARRRPRREPRCRRPPARRGPPSTDPVTAEIGVHLGGAYRLGEAPAFGIVNRGGAVAGAGVAVAPSPRFSFGLAYEHVGLGNEHGAGGLAVVDLRRTIAGVWATVRLTILRVDWFALGWSPSAPGLAWQHVDAGVVL